MESHSNKRYGQQVVLPESLESKFQIRSCLAYRREQQVYLVQDEKKALCILKIAEGRQAVFLQKEAKLLQQLDFSFLPECRFFMKTEQSSYMLREYIEGDTLWECVERYGPYPVQESAELMLRLCKMISQFHAQKPPLIHRDIKPQNFVVTPEKNLFLLDMGTVRRYKKDRTQDTVPLGTRMTAAPEQYGYCQTDIRVDIYALGVVWFYLLTGTMDMSGYKGWKKYPEDCRLIIQKCTKMDPEDRYRSCQELEKVIEKKVLAGKSMKFARRKCRRRRQ